MRRRSSETVFSSRNSVVQTDARTCAKRVVSSGKSNAGDASHSSRDHWETSLGKCASILGTQVIVESEAKT